MNMGALSLFSRTNNKALFNIAAWHNPRSLTWRWIVSVYFRRPSFTPHLHAYSNRGPHWSRKWGFGTLFTGWNWGLSVGLGTFLFFRIDHRSAAISLCGAELGLVTQRPMWRRDLPPA